MWHTLQPTSENQLIYVNAISSHSDSVLRLLPVKAHGKRLCALAQTLGQASARFVRPCSPGRGLRRCCNALALLLINPSHSDRFRCDFNELAFHDVFDSILERKLHRGSKVGLLISAGRSHVGQLLRSANIDLQVTWPRVDSNDLIHKYL